MTAAPPLADLRALASPSPAQWPKDVARIAKRFSMALRVAEGLDNNSAVVRCDDLEVALGALATLPPHERVKGLTDALHRIAHPYGETTFNDLVEIATTALASYRGEAT